MTDDSMHAINHIKEKGRRLTEHEMTTASFVVTGRRVVVGCY